MNNRKNESIKITALGGVGEFGKNMYLVEVDGDIFVLDSGLMIPENEMFGIDIVIPDFTYLIHNKERVKGIFLTHGHEDHIGALSYILREINVPVYGTKLTLALAKAKLKEQEYKGQFNFIEIHSNNKIEFPSADVSFFHTTHSIPDSVGICIHTSEGSIVYTGDFKFDQAASSLYKPEIGKMAKIGEEGVLCLLSDSTEAEKPGYTQSEAQVVSQVTDAFHNAPGRIIAASFASDLIRIQHVFDAAYQSGRKVAVAGKFSQTAFDIALKLGYLHAQDELIIPMSQITEYPDDEVVILATGSQGEPIEVLQKMAKQMHKQINIKQGDTVMLTASPLRGSEVFIFKTVDMLYRAGANVITGKGAFKTSSHGSQEELKFMINLMKPKFFIPVHGEYRMLKAHAKVALECGLMQEQIFIPEKGEIAEIKEGRIRPAGRILSGNILIDGSGIGDVGNIVLRDRKLLSQDGILLVVVTLNKKEKVISAGPEIISRGFVYVRESEQLLVEATKKVREVVEKSISKETFDWSGIKQDMRDVLNQYLYEKTKRRPMILPIIMEV
ncbi:ribonuclease J [Bacillus sp. S/N-304-OC-R1]|uniref:ribonuclease J n=1 Tax=Bacillus sp. S/N-304-OC-R1 TaxID=2758034 RepID=UPI001C8EE4E7|nr:ribonuclease J [Bacillus sp. S/N-304-OC-R1]MBY0120637.1 ribonuclease J [Bacillus sp. S/N-304-OC-R1]